MIIPAEFNFKDDADAREKMTSYIKAHFGPILGAKMNLIDAPNGIELIYQEVQVKMAEAGLSREARKLRIA